MTTNITLQLDRESWLTEAAQLIQDDIIRPALPSGHVIENPFRVSVGFPPNSRASSKHIACCIIAGASADNHNELFISPVEDDSHKILGSLVHEMIHQADDCKSGHRNFFAHVARKVGLEGKFTATTAGDKLNRYFDSLINLLGKIPHGKINIDKAKAKQGTRMIKVYCPECLFQFRTTQVQLEKIQVTECPACMIGDLTAQTK